MKYQRVSLSAFFLAMILAGAAVAQQPPAQQQPARQQPAKKRSVKYPPQFPHIIDTEQSRAQEKNESAPAAPDPAAQQMELLVRAVQSLAGEVKSLTQEMRTLNVRQQAQLDMLRLQRADGRVDIYERELKATRDRIIQLEADERTLQQLMTPESLAAQIRTVGTLNRDETMRQLKAGHEARLRNVTEEKEMLQKREIELVVLLEGYRVANTEAEKRIQQADDLLRRLDPSLIEQKKEGAPNPAKPSSVPPAERKP
jgi:hypothetical protein